MEHDPLISELRAAGVTFRLVGDALTLEADSPPPSSLVEKIQAHKGALLEWLRGKATGALDHGQPIPPEWADDFGERAGVLEFEQGLSRADAERVARELVLKLAEGRR
ncbi:MAG: hypothetical protein HQL56_11675 [Magnetococcales bacterium]|nr:hypothetical protein [Magnetococcales bacterium]